MPHLRREASLVFYALFPQDVFPAGADGIPGAVPADILQHFRGHLSVDLTDQILIDVFFFFQMKVIRDLPVVNENLPVIIAESLALFITIWREYPRF